MNNHPLCAYSALGGDSLSISTIFTWIVIRLGLLVKGLKVCIHILAAAVNCLEMDFTGFGQPMGKPIWI